MTKLSADAELALRRLDDEDGAETDCTERQPYRRLGAWVLAELQDLAGIKALAKAGLGPERLAPAKRKRGEHCHKPDPIAFAMDDVSRLKGIMSIAAAELIAAERCRRAAPHAGLHGQQCSTDEYGDLEDAEAELEAIVDKIHNRLRAGTTGAQRRRRAK